MGFFAWLREGVRRAVLMGFSDAIAEIGNRNDQDELGLQLAATFQQSIPEQTRASLTTVQSSTGRKRLGKSLAQISDAAQA